MFLCDKIAAWRITTRRLIILGLVFSLLLTGAAIFATLPPSATNVYVVQIADSPVVEVTVVIPYPAGDGPLAHYTEHLVWLNTIGRTARAADRHTNAWTNPQAIGYELTGDSKDLADLLGTLFGIFDPIDLPPSFAAEERSIILREYEYRIVGNIDAQAAEALDAFLYEGNAIAASVIGTPAQINTLDDAAARDFQAQTHQPENALLVVTGAVTERQVSRALRAAGWPRPPSDRSEPTPQPFDLAELAQKQLRYPLPDAAPRLLWRRVVDLPDPVPFDLLEAELVLLADILNSNLPGGLAGPLQYDAAIVRSFELQIWPIDEDSIEISFRAAPDSDVTLTTLQAVFEAQLSGIAAAGIPQDTYARVLARSDDYWPDWADEDETADWKADYVIDRVTNLQQPLSRRALKPLKNALSLTTSNTLLRQLVTEGRSASAFIGPEETFE